MNHREFLAEADDILAQRGESYGGVEESFTRAAQLATLKLNMPITAYVVATIMESVKDARLAVNPDHWDSHVDGINYRAFRGEFSGALKGEQTTAVIQPAVMSTPSTKEVANILRDTVQGAPAGFDPLNPSAHPSWSNMAQAAVAQAVSSDPAPEPVADAASRLRG